MSKYGENSMCTHDRVYYLQNYNKLSKPSSEMLLTENKEFDIFVASKIGSFKRK